MRRIVRSKQADDKQADLYSTLNNTRTHSRGSQDLDMCHSRSFSRQFRITESKTSMLTLLHRSHTDRLTDRLSERNRREKKGAKKDMYVAVEEMKSLSNHLDSEGTSLRRKIFQKEVACIDRSKNGSGSTV